MAPREPAWALRRNPLQEAMRAGEAAVALWVTSPWTPVLEILGAAGADGALIDLEHVSHGVEEAERMIVAADAAGISAVVRPPAIDATLVSRLLDAGAHGIVFPRVGDAATAERAVACTRYPPAGLRGWGGAHTRFAMWQGGYATDHFDGRRSDPGVYRAEYVEAAERQTLVIVLIETLQGVENAPAIIATEGVDAVIFGWGDLAVEVGFDQERCREAAAAVIGECRRRGVGVGISPGQDFFPGCFTIAGIDTLLMSAALEGAVRTARATVASSPRASSTPPR